MEAKVTENRGGQNETEGKARAILRHDFPASIVVFLVALPLCLGIAIASGVPPAAGLVTGIVGGLLVGIISGAPLQVSGPAAGLTVICWDIVQQHGLATLGMVVLLGGLIQAVAALFGLGRWFRAVSPAVVYGMLGGIGVLIFASQFHVMVDDDPRSSGIANLLAIPEAITKGVAIVPDTSHHWAAMLGLTTIAVILLWGNFAPKRVRMVPAPLIAIVVTTALAAIVQAPVQYIDVPDNLFDSLHVFELSRLSQLADPALLVSAAGLAVVASAETLLCAGAVDRMQDRVKADFNRELLAQGVGNTICGFLGALPMTGVIVRSSANVDAGARTRASAIMHGAWILALVLAFSALLRVIPTAGLAAILVYTGYKLVNPGQIRELLRYGWSSVGIYAATLAGIVATDLLKGVLLGVVLSLVRLIWRLGHLQVEYKTSESGARVDAYLYGAATFVALPKLIDAMEAIPQTQEVHLHVEQLRYIDHACIVAIGDWERERRGSGHRVFIEWESIEARSDRADPGQAEPRSTDSAA